jgi:hypothetical protein
MVAQKTPSWIDLTARQEIRHKRPSIPHAKKQKGWKARGLSDSISETERKSYLSGIGAGFTLPQSGPLYTEVETMVYSTGVGFGPICMVPIKCTLPMA